MKKSLILAGMLAVGHANAQEGNVGINTEFPKATLEVLPSANNLTGTTNEGIVAPKLSKTRIASIADTNLVEGTLIYATDATYTGNNAKVAKITEKGYYFYNGTEWVKVQYNDTDTNLWYINSDHNYQLNNTSTNAKINNFYTPVGANWNISKNFQNETYDGLTSSSGGGQESTNISEYDHIIKGKEANSMLYNRVYSSEIDKISNNRVRRLVTNELILDNSTELSSNDAFTSESNRLRIPQENTKDISDIYAQTNFILHNGSGNISSLYSSSNQMSIQGNVQNARALDANTSVKKGEITNLHNTRSYIALSSDGDASIKSMDIFRGIITKNRTFTGNVEQIRGLYLSIPKTIEPNEQYGIYIENIDGAKEIEGMAKNYAVYTNAGQIRIGDLAQTGGGDRIVYTDENGVLKAGSAISTKAGEIASTTAMECNADNRGKMNFVPNDEGSDVFGICLRNKNGNYYWGYMVGGNNPTNGSGAFGSGL